MKVALVSQPFDGIIPPRQNSIGLSIYEIAIRLAEYGKVFVFGNLKDIRPENVPQNVYFQHIPVDVDNRLIKMASAMSMNRSRGKRPLIASRAAYALYAHRIANLIKKNNIDIVNVFNFSQFVPIIKSKNPNSAMYLHMRCEWLSQLDRQWIERRISGTDVIVGCSEHITSSIKRRFPNYAERCVTLQNGVEITAVRERCAATRKIPRQILFVGRISPEKGVHLLVDAFIQIAKRHPDAQLHLIGSPLKLPYDYLVALSQDPNVIALRRFYQDSSPQSYFRSLQASISAAGLSDRATFHGYIAHDKMATFYRDAYVVVNPSLSESFGRSLVEAMAAGVPVIASRVGGMVDIINNGDTGVLVNANSAHDLAHALDTLLDDDSLWLKFSENGLRRAIEEYSWEHVVNRLITVYQRRSSLR